MQLVLLVSLLLHSAQTFTIAPAFSRVSSPLAMAGMAQPETKIKTKVTTQEVTKQAQKSKQKIRADDPVSRREEDFQDAPMFILYLLHDESYDPEHVITRMCAIMEDMDEDQAATVFKQAKQQGKAMCGKYPFERAELFKEQLLRSDPMIFADMTEENS